MPTKGVAIVMHFYAGNASGPVTGDQANLTMSVVKDGVMSSLSVTTVTQANATYCPGIYSVSLDTDENDADTVTLTGYSSTADVIVTPTTWTNVPPLTAAAAADAIWDELTSGHTTAGTFGQQCKTDIDDIYSLASANGGKLDTIDTVVDSILVDTGTTLDGKIDAVDTVVDAILVDTDTTIPALLAAGVPVSSLGAGSISASTFAADAITAAKIADDAIGVDQIKDGAITADKIAGSAITEAKIKDGAISQDKITANVSANLKQINGSTTGVSGLQTATSTVVEAQVHTGSSSTSIVSDSAGLHASDSAYVRRNLTFISGALQNETSVISAYVGSTKTLTVSVAFTTAPAEDDLFIIS